MNATIPTARPNFHALTGTQPVGQIQITVLAEYAGTITTVKRCNETYWVVGTRDARNAFRGPWSARHRSCAIWQDGRTGAFVVDYWDAGTNIEAGRTRSLQAAIGVACDVTAQRWLASR